jgi:hypothetical protein
MLLLALANNELDKFLVGEPSYFQEAKSDNDEPQNIVAAFDLLLLRYWQETHDPFFSRALCDGLAENSGDLP